MTGAAGDTDANKKIKTGFTCAAGYSAATDLSGCVDCSKGGTLGVSAAFKTCTIADTADGTAATAVSCNDGYYVLGATKCVACTDTAGPIKSNKDGTTALVG